MTMISKCAGWTVALALASVGCARAERVKLPTGSLEKGGVTFDFKAFYESRLEMCDPADPANVAAKAEWKRDVGICHMEVPAGSPAHRMAWKTAVFIQTNGILRMSKPLKMREALSGFGFTNLHCCVEGDWRTFLPEMNAAGTTYRISFRYRFRHTLPQVGYSYPGGVLLHHYAMRDPKTGRYSKQTKRNIWGLLESDDWDSWRDFSAEFATTGGTAGFDVELRHDGVGDLEVKDFAIVPIPHRSDSADVRLMPHGLFDNEFAFSAGQSLQLTWVWRDSLASTRKRQGYSVEFALPKGFDYVDDSFSDRKTRCIERKPDGSSRVTLSVRRRDAAFGTDFRCWDEPSLLVKSTGEPGTEGICRVKVSYEGVRIGGGKVRFFTIPKILARTPERFDFAMMPGAGMSNLFETPEGVDEYMKSLVEYGARLLAIEGGCWSDSPSVARQMYAAFRRHGGRRITPSLNFLKNAYFVGPGPHPELDRYVTDAKSDVSGYRMIQGAVCPKAIYEERGDFMTNTVPYLRSRLAGCDGVRSNYEPFMFFGNGCYCERCRAGFAKWAGLDERELAAKWPAAVKPRAELALKFQRYRSEELGRVAVTLDKHIRAITGGRKSMGFIPAPSWREYIYDPKDSESDYSPRDYNEKLEWVAPWGPYVIWNADNDYAYRKGSPLAHFIAARKMREMIDSTLPPERRPKLAGCTQGLQSGTWVTQPEWLEMALDSYFFNRWENVQAYFFPEGFDARYCRAYANAATRAADYETYVWDGVRCDGDFFVKPVAEYALPAPYVSSYMRDEKDVSLLQRAAWRKGTSVAVVVFNFWERGEAFFDLKAKGFGSGHYLVLAEDGVLWAKDRSEPGWTAAELERGVRLAVPASRTRVFEIVPEDVKTLARAKSVLTASDVGRIFAERHPALVRAAEEDAAVQDEQKKVKVDRKAEL